jgi:chromosome partitioning protein
MIPWWDYFRARQARQELTDVKVPMFSGWIRLRPAFSRAAEMGVPVYEIDTKGARDGWKDYQSVGEEALKLVGIGGAGDGGSS